MQTPTHSMDGAQSPPLPDRFSLNGVHDTTSSDTELAYSSEESNTFVNLLKHQSKLHRQIESSHSCHKDRLGAVVRELGPTYVVFKGPAPCEAPVTLKTGETSKAASKMRSFMKKVTTKRSGQTELCPDKYVGSRDVMGLNSNTFKKFLKQLDVAFVLFYNPFDDNCRWAKLNMKKAAADTEREKHAYAAVDCTKECQLCKTQGITSFPTMKLFSRGRLVNTYGNDTVLQSSEIQTFVEKVPVSDQEGTKSCCVLQ